MKIKHFKKTLIMNNKWTKTCKALKKLLDILICSKCKNNLHDPHQFLKCGHFSCLSCMNSNSINCIDCELSCTNNDVIKDETIAKIVQACYTIAEEIGLREETKNVATESNKEPSLEPNEKDSNIVNDVQSNSSKSLLNNGKKKSSKKFGKRKRNATLNNTDESKKIKCDKTSDVLRIPKNIDKKNPHGETLLQEKCRKGHIEFVKILLEAGANPNTCCAAKWTPLQEAADLGFYEITKMLLEAKANVNQQGFEGRTALHEAARKEDLKMIELLLNHGAQKDLVDEENKRPIDYCKSTEIKNFLNTGDIKESDSKENSIQVYDSVTDINHVIFISKKSNNYIKELNETTVCDNASIKNGQDNMINPEPNNNNISHDNGEDDIAIVFEHLNSNKNIVNHLRETADHCSSQQSIDVVNCNTKNGAINISNNVSQRNIDFTHKNENSNNTRYIECSQESIDVVNYEHSPNNANAINLFYNIPQRNIDFIQKRENCNNLSCIEYSQNSTNVMSHNKNVNDSSQNNLSDSEEIIVD